MPFAKPYLKLAFIGYLARRFDRVLIALERFAHLGLAFKIKLVRAHAHAILIVNIFGRLYAQKKVLSLGIRLIYIVYIVCGYCFYFNLPGKLIELWKHVKLLRYAVVLKLNIKIVIEHGL